jgi:hypothetical protein
MTVEKGVMDDTEDLIRRLKLSIAGFDRGEHVSSWVTWKLNQECVAELERLKRGETMNKNDAERQFEIEASTMSREQLYELAKRQAMKIAALEDCIRGAMVGVQDLLSDLEEYKKD